MRIADGIVRPRRELVLAAVGGPSVAAALGRGLEAERGIGDHIDPGRRRRLARAEYRHVFLAACRKSAETVEEFELGRTRRRERSGEPRGSLSGRIGASGSLDAIELIRKAAVLRRDHDARRRDQQRPRRGVDEVGPKNEDPAGSALDAGNRPRLTGAHQGLDRDLKVLHVRGSALVQDDEIDRELLHQPIFVRLQDLAGDVESFRCRRFAAARSAGRLICPADQRPDCGPEPCRIVSDEGRANRGSRR